MSELFLLPRPTEPEAVDPQIIEDIRTAAASENYFLMLWSKERGTNAFAETTKKVMHGVIEASRPLIKRLVDISGATELCVEVNTKPVLPGVAQIEFTDKWHIDTYKQPSKKTSLIVASSLPTLHAFGQLPENHPVIAAYVKPASNLLHDRVTAAIQANELEVITPEPHEFVVFSVNGIHTAQENKSDEPIDRTSVKLTVTN